LLIKKNPPQKRGGGAFVEIAKKKGWENAKAKA